jgi:hypothetical protein
VPQRLATHHPTRLGRVPLSNRRAAADIHATMPQAFVEDQNIEDADVEYTVRVAAGHAEQPPQRRPCLRHRLAVALHLRLPV